ncbi:MAG TPA: epimerase [Ktedonosporobacter sp.]|nr:epimerase [Ktedonosporobacter sp.]
MKILILGGTIFQGRHLVEAALSHGHEVTLFNRGQHGPELYPQVEHLRGDRRGDLHALEGRTWDAAIDTNGYVPSIVRASARLLADAVRQYVFVSSISVYPDVSTIGLDETAPIGQMTLEQLQVAENILPPAKGIIAGAYGESYGPLKGLCEQAVEEVMPDRALSVRLGLIVGPHDYSDRFTYWPGRVARGGEVLAPGRKRRPVQLIDVRDAAEWMIRMVEAGQMGIYNVTGQAESLSMQQLLDTCAVVSGSDATFTWVDDAFMLEEKIQPWWQMPLWLPEEPALAGFNAISIAKALAAGLTFRPLAETVRDTLAWDSTRPAGEERRAGLPADDEARLLRV